MKAIEREKRYEERVSLYKSKTDKIVEVLIKKVKSAKDKKYLKVFLQTNLKT